MNSEFICPRLIDYVAIVGLRDPNKASKDKIVPPELLRRYPPTDHYNATLPPDVVHFCQPDGCSSSRRNSPSSSPTTHQFVFNLTDKETGTIRYGVCHNFLRPINRRSPSRSSPRHHHKRPRPPAPSTPHSPHPSSTITPNLRQLSKSSSKQVSSSVSSKLLKPVDNRRRNKPRTHSLTSLLIITHHPFYRGLHKCLEVLKNVIDKLDYRAKKRSNGKESIWPILLCTVTESINTILQHDVMEIETWIYRLLSAPVPVPGITKVELSLLPDNIMEPLIFALPDTERFSLADFPLHSIFELMGVEFALKLFLAVLLENKVIIQSKNYSALSHTILAIKAFIYPLEYMFPIVILLPSIMPESEQLFMVPSPFIIGIPTTFLSLRRNFNIPVDILLFDIDERKLLRCDNNGGLCTSSIDQFISLPPSSDFNTLIKHIKQALISISDVMQPIKNLDDVMAKKNPSPSSPSSPLSMRSTSLLFSKQKSSSVSSNIFDYNPLIFGNDSDSVDISTRIAMIRFFNSPNILGNFTKFTRILKLYPKPIVAFQTHNFIKSRKEDSEFIKKLSNTQAILSFGEWIVNPNNSVFLKVIAEHRHDPRAIGDKAKWYQSALECVQFRVYREDGSCTLHLLDLPGSTTFSSSNTGATGSSKPSDSATPTDESGSDSDGFVWRGSGNLNPDNQDPMTSCSSSPEDSSHYNRQCDIIETTTDSGFSANSNDYQRQISLDLTKVYNPPTYLHIPNVEHFIDTTRRLPYSLNNTISNILPKTVTDINTNSANSLRPQTLQPRNWVVSDTEEMVVKRKLSKKKNLSKQSVTLLKKGDSEECVASKNSLTSETNLNRDKYDESSDIVDESPLSSIVNEAKDRFFRMFGSPTSSKFNLTTVDSNPRKLRPSVSRSSVIRSSDLTSKIRDAHNHETGVLPNLTSRRSSASSASYFARKDSVEKEARENQEELIKISDEVMRGQKPGFLQQLKLKKLLEHEEYRNLVLSKINSHLNDGVNGQKKSKEQQQQVVNKEDKLGTIDGSVVSHGESGAGCHDEGSHVDGSVIRDSTRDNETIENDIDDDEDREQQKDNKEFIQDYAIGSEDQFNALLCVCQLIMYGIQQSYITGNRSSVDGLGSVFVLLEMLHTHYIDLTEPGVSSAAGVGSGIIMGGGSTGRYRISLPPSMNPSPTTTESRYPVNNDESSQIITSISNPLNINGEEYENIDLPTNTPTNASIVSEHPPNKSSPSHHLHYTPHPHPIPPHSSSHSVAQSQSRPTNLELTSNLSSSMLSILEGLRMKIAYNFNLNEKSWDCQGYRYRLNQLYYTRVPVLPGENEHPHNYTFNNTSPSLININQSKSVSSRRTSFLSRLLFLSPTSQIPPPTDNTSTIIGNNGPKSVPDGISPLLDNVSNIFGGGYEATQRHTHRSHQSTRLYLYQKLINFNEKNSLWHNMTFWEDVFYDAVCQEREIIGMDANPQDLLDRYSTLDPSEKQRLERKEDRLLGIILNNLVAFMVMMRVDIIKVRSKANCMMGKSHIGLDESSNINKLVDSLAHLKGNAVDLRLNLSRRQSAPTYSVYFCPQTPLPTDPPHQRKHSTLSSKWLLITEIYDDCLLLKSVSGRIIYRWWYDRIVRCSCKKNVISISFRDNNEINTVALYCKKSKELIANIQKTWSEFNKSTEVSINNYLVTDEVTKSAGTLKVSSEGIRFTTENSEWFVQLLYVRKCCTRRPDKFIIEIIDPNTKNVTYRIFKSNDATALLRQFKKIRHTIALNSLSSSGGYESPIYRNSGNSSSSSICGGPNAHHGGGILMLDTDDDWETYSITTQSLSTTSNISVIEESRNEENNNYNMYVCM